MGSHNYPAVRKPREMRRDRYSRDAAVKRLVCKFKRLLPAFNEQQYNSQLRGYATCTLLLERAYDVLGKP
jgi:hypothetical protein